jgi:hypothetical protein
MILKNNEENMILKNNERTKPKPRNEDHEKDHSD